MEPGCRELIESGPRCPEHARLRARETHKVGARIYRTKRWRVLRRQVLADHPRCSTPDCPRMATEVDHKVPLFERGDPWDRSNLQPLCKSHHSQKTNVEIRRRVY